VAEEQGRDDRHACAHGHGFQQRKAEHDLRHEDRQHEDVPSQRGSSMR
jgi:hypothetical protein